LLTPDPFIILFCFLLHTAAKIIQYVQVHKKLTMVGLHVSMKHDLMSAVKHLSDLNMNEQRICIYIKHHILLM